MYIFIGMSLNNYIISACVYGYVCKSDNSVYCELVCEWKGVWVGCGVCLTFARYVINLFSKRFKWVTSELCLRILWIWWGNPIMPWPWWRPLSKHFIIFYVWITLRWETSLETWVLGAFWMKRTIFFLHVRRDFV